MNRKIVSIYKSLKKDEMYLYIEKKGGLDEVPDELRTLFGTPKHVVDFLLTEDKKLARAEAAKVLSEIEEKGYYLQMPPARDDYMLDLYKDTSHKYEGLE